MRRSEVRASSVADLYASDVARAENITIDFVREESGVDISGHKPEDLKAIDRLLGPRLRDGLRRVDKGYDRASHAIGSYLGEVIVRNLGGRWRFPRFWETFVGLFSRDSLKRTDKDWFVLLEGEEIHVFRAAWEALDQGLGKSSLYEFYRQLSAGRQNREPT